MRDVHQDSGERAGPSGSQRCLRHARRRQGIQHALHGRPRGVVHGEHVICGTLATRRELSLTIADVWATANGVPEIELVRPGQVQHEIADGIGLRVGTPPQIVFVQGVETGANLPGKFVEQAVPDHLQKLSIEGCVHEAQ